MRAGRYSIAVVDRSPTQNFHIVGKGVNLRTRVAFQGTRTWTVRFRKGTRVKYFSDAARRTLKGSFTVR